MSALPPSDEWELRIDDEQAIKNKERRARRKAARPPWVSAEEMNAILFGCPPGHHCDHIQPIVGQRWSPWSNPPLEPGDDPAWATGKLRVSCGLDVPHNLNYLSAAENHNKTNRAVHPAYLDWWSEQGCVYAEPQGNLWQPAWYE